MRPHSAGREDLRTGRAAEARALYGALAAVAGAAARRSARPVHRTSSKEPVEVLGHHRIGRLRRR
ncbi:hypothetical protein [Streptomyces phaeoluteigriseus]